MPVTSSLHPAVGTSPSVAAASDLDRVHDHLVRVTGDRDLAARVTQDVARRAADRARDLGEQPRLHRLLLLAHARLAAAPAHVAPTGDAVADALAALPRADAILLDATVRQGLSLRRAASLAGLPARQAKHRLVAARDRFEVALRDRGASGRLDALLATLPVLGATAPAVTTPTPATDRRVRTALAWTGTAAVALLALTAAVVLPSTLAIADTTEVPVAQATSVDDRSVAPDRPDPGPVRELVVLPNDRDPIAAVDGGQDPAPTATSPSPAPPPSPTTRPRPSEGPSAAPSDEPEPADEPAPSPSPRPAPVPLPLPTGP